MGIRGGEHSGDPAARAERRGCAASFAWLGSQGRHRASRAGRSPARPPRPRTPALSDGGRSRTAASRARALRGRREGRGLRRPRAEAGGEEGGARPQGRGRSSRRRRRRRAARARARRRPPVSRGAAAARRRDVTEAEAVVGAGSAAAKCELRWLAPREEWSRLRGRGGAGRRRPARCCSRAGAPGSRLWLQPSPLAALCSALAPLLSALEPGGGGAPPPTLPGLPPVAPQSRARAGPGNCRCGRRSAFPPAARAQCSGGGGVSAASRPGVGGRPPCPRLGPAPRSRGPFPAQGPAAGAGRAYSMEICYQLPVLPLDRPVPQHVLSRRGAISFSSSSALFGCPNPRQLSQRRGAISYDSSDQTALYIRMLGDVRVRSRAGFESERRGSHPYIDFRIFHAQSEIEVSVSARNIRRLLSFQRYLRSSRFFRGTTVSNSLNILDDDYNGQAKCMLGKVGNWNFDIFLFDRLTNGNSLVSLTCHLFSLHGLIEYFHLDMVKLRRFLVMIQEDYHSQNPYHNAVHAADVTQAMHCYLREPKLANSVTPWDVLLSLIAAATHDLDHPGVNQPFLIKTNHHLATLYKNTSVLENHHWRSAVGLLRESGLFSHMPLESRKQMETQIGALILATDISRQNEYLSLFRSHLDRGDLCLEDARHRHLVLQMALKCADICNPCRTWELSKQWGEKVTEEFFHQGDIEKKHQLVVSPLCDRQTESIANIQIGFMTYLVEPLFTEWARFSNTRLSQTMLGHVGLNKASWKGLQREQSSSEDTEAALEELNSQLLPQENRLS